MCRNCNYGIPTAYIYKGFKKPQRYVGQKKSNKIKPNISYADATKTNIITSKTTNQNRNEDDNPNNLTADPYYNKQQ